MPHILIYSILVLVTTALGLASRHPAIDLPPFLAAYLGDTLWAMLVYWCFRLIGKRHSLRRAGMAALLFAYLVEVSQLYQADWANALRDYKIVGLIFGYGFLWSDLVCYTVGVLAGLAIDRWLIRRA